MAPSIDMAEFRKDSKERAGENIMLQASDIMPCYRAGFESECPSSLNKCFEEVQVLREAGVPMHTPGCGGRLHAHQILRTMSWLLQNKTSLSKNERKVGHHIGDAVNDMTCCFAALSAPSRWTSPTTAESVYYTSNYHTGLEVQM